MEHRDFTAGYDGDDGPADCTTHELLHLGCQDVWRLTSRPGSHDKQCLHFIFFEGRKLQTFF